MIVHCHVAGGKDREEALALSLKDAVALFGDDIVVSQSADWNGAPTGDIGVVFGLKGASRSIMDAYLAAGKSFILFDKALIRVPGAKTKQMRVCLNAATPMKYMMRRKRSSSRWQDQRVNMVPRRERKKRAPVVLALSSQKYCTFHDLGDATQYAESVVNGIRKVTEKREIIYRPKPSWHDFLPVEGTRLSRNPEYLQDLLAQAHCVVTHGSSAAIDAVLAGVPAIALGHCAASPVVSDSLEAIVHPFFADEETRWTWACNLAWCQWSVGELHTGEAWDFIKSELKELAACR